MTETAASWLHKGSSLGEKVLILSDKSILLTNIQQSDTGNYVCSGTNSIGNDFMAKCTVKLRGKSPVIMC